MNCKQAEKLLPLYAGRDLEETRVTLLTEHVQTCAACSRVADEYRESIQLTEQFAPPVFSEAFYAGIRQRVLREIETEAMAPAWPQTIMSLFRPRLTWAIAGVLLTIVSMLAIYFIVIRGNDEQQLADKLPAKVQPGTEERRNAGLQDNKQAGLPHSLNTGGNEQQLAGGTQPHRKRSRDTVGPRMNTVSAKSPDAMSTTKSVSSQPGNLPGPVVFPHRDSAASVKTLRVEIQTKDPKIKIIWFVQQETKLEIPKGT